MVLGCNVELVWVRVSRELRQSRTITCSSRCVWLAYSDECVASQPLPSQPFLSEMSSNIGYGTPRFSSPIHALNFFLLNVFALNLVGSVLFCSYISIPLL
ncbi:hypothetical protein V6N12_016269 [Hibiscus sabdariffa]|uniref:Uncharacterized protein n=1 Tax=Hibiscus sabdariffa TaxID=183260 RepID=A0ABR2CD36_9ROSI